MDSYTRAMMTLIRDAFEQVAGARPYQSGSEARSYYLARLDDNLYRPMDAVAQAAYGQGSGGEIASGKMNSLRSSSALTYNLFWNRTARFSGRSARIGAGCYAVEFEKQYPTLKPAAAGLPANLDALLYCADTCEAVACEMKMLEWLFGRPGMLRRRYLTPANYIREDAGRVFAAIAAELIRRDESGDPEKYPCRMTRYDAFQMFKHTSACYSACVSAEPRPIKKLTLVNCAWTLSTPEALAPQHRARYLREEACELREFEEFRQIMQPAAALFADIGVDFAICFYSFCDFLALLDKDADELRYLRRYTLRGAESAQTGGPV